MIRPSPCVRFRRRARVRNAAIEVLKLYLQKEFNLTRDYRIPGSMRKGNYYGE